MPPPSAALILTPLLVFIPLAKGGIDLAIATSYLAKYGYLEKSSSVESLGTVLTKLQAFAGLEQTGEIDRETEEIMMMRRCGVKDIPEDNQQGPGELSEYLKSSRSKRYVLQGSRWKRKSKTKTIPIKLLTYKISKYPSRGLSRSAVDMTSRQAMAV